MDSVNVEAIVSEIHLNGPEVTASRLRENPVPCNLFTLSFFLELNVIYGFCSVDEKGPSFLPRGQQSLEFALYLAHRDGDSMLDATGNVVRGNSATKTENKQYVRRIWVAFGIFFSKVLFVFVFYFVQVVLVGLCVPGDPRFLSLMSAIGKEAFPGNWVIWWQTHRGLLRELSQDRGIGHQARACEKALFTLWP